MRLELLKIYGKLYLAENLLDRDLVFLSSCMYICHENLIAACIFGYFLKAFCCNLKKNKQTWPPICRSQEERKTFTLENNGNNLIKKIILLQYLKLLSIMYSKFVFVKNI